MIECAYLMLKEQSKKMHIMIRTQELIRNDRSKFDERMESLN